MIKIVLVLWCFSNLVCAKTSKENLRIKRWFEITYMTETVIEPHTVRAIVPSTCIQVDPFIPPCKNNLSFNYLNNIVRYEEDM